MPITISGKIEFPYAEQLSSVFCGPACIEMMLNYLQVKLAIDPNDTRPTQQILNTNEYRDFKPNGLVSITGHPSWPTWITSPEKMINVLHKADADSGHWINYYDVANHNNNFNVTRKLFLEDLVLRTTNDSNLPPPIVPVHGNSHWVVLYQYTEKDGKKSFNGNDPIYYATKTKTGTSGSESFSCEGKINVAHKNINFMTPASMLMLEQTVNNANLTSRMRWQPPAPPIAILPVTQPTKPIPARDVPKIVLEKLDAFGINSPCLAGRHIQGTTPGDPLLVRRLEQNPNDSSDDYYLISLQKPSFENYLLVRIDATTGQYLDSLGIPPTQYLLGKSTSDPFLNEILNTMPAELKSPFQQQLLSNPRLIWKPCVQSLSPFYPFYEVTVPATPRKPSTKYYVRIDGKFFTEGQLMVMPNT